PCGATFRRPRYPVFSTLLVGSNSLTLFDHNDVRPRALLVLIGSTRETRPPCSIVTTPKKKKGLRPGSMPSEEAVRRLEAVTDTALARLSLEELLRELLVRVRSILRADTAAILLLNGGDLVARVAQGLEEEVEAGVRDRVRAFVPGGPGDQPPEGRVPRHRVPRAPHPAHPDPRLGQSAAAARARSRPHRARARGDRP